jgi:polar amino acid transport system permease protein
LRGVRLVAAVYTELFKNVPLLAIIFLTYFGLASAGLRLGVSRRAA